MPPFDGGMNVEKSAKTRRFHLISTVTNIFMFFYGSRGAENRLKLPLASGQVPPSQPTGGSFGGEHRFCVGAEHGVPARGIATLIGKRLTRTASPYYEHVPANTGSQSLCHAGAAPTANRPIRGSVVASPAVAVPLALALRWRSVRGTGLRLPCPRPASPRISQRSARGRTRSWQVYPHRRTGSPGRPQSDRTAGGQTVLGGGLSAHVARRSSGPPHRCSGPHGTTRRSGHLSGRSSRPASSGSGWFQ